MSVKSSVRLLGSLWIGSAVKDGAVSIGANALGSVSSSKGVCVKLHSVTQPTNSSADAHFAGSVDLCSGTHPREGLAIGSCLYMFSGSNPRYL